MAKLLEDTYRHVNIALVNEMAKFCGELAIDIWGVIDCAATKPFGLQAFYPGPGVGGHCVPIDPNYLAFKVQSELGYRCRFVELAREINMGMPPYIVDRAARILNDVGKAVNDAKILLLGVTYEEDVGDRRESRARHVAHELMKRSAVLTFHDSLISHWVVKGNTDPKTENLLESVRSADLTILLQAHSDYDDELLQSDCHRLFDTRGRTSPEGVCIVVKPIPVHAGSLSRSRYNDFVELFQSVALHTVQLVRPDHRRSTVPNCGSLPGWRK